MNGLAGWAQALTVCEGTHLPTYPYARKQQTSFSYYLFYRSLSAPSKCLYVMACSGYCIVHVMVFGVQYMCHSCCANVMHTLSTAWKVTNNICVYCNVCSTYRKHYQHTSNPSIHSNWYTKHMTKYQMNVCGSAISATHRITVWSSSALVLCLVHIVLLRCASRVGCHWYHTDVYKYYIETNRF